MKKNDKRVVVFTHGIDIDGFGCAILARLAFREPKIVFADNFDLDEKFTEFENKNNLLDFDNIFVTDHCLSLELCERLSKRGELAGKLLVLDHHRSRLGQQDRFEFVKIVVENEFGKCSGTSLFYEYLTSSGNLAKTEKLDDFVNLTTLYDTWQWVNDDKNGQRAYRLNALFQAVGREEYIETVLTKLEQGRSLFSPEIESIIDKYLRNFNLKIEEFYQKIRVYEFNGKKFGLVELADLYKNDLPNFVRNNGRKMRLDFLMMPIEYRDTVSLRSIGDFDVSEFAKNFGGSGHRAAASFPKCNLEKALMLAKKID